jgi:hypothetical protein
MPTSYPSGLDNFTNPTASDQLDSVTVPHASQHTNINDAVEAIETALGANLANVVVPARTISTTSPLAGGGDLSGNRTLSIDDATTSVKGAVQLTDSVSSTSTTTAATPNAVKTAYDYADLKTPKLAIPSTYYITTPFQSYANITATLSRTNYIPIYVPATTTFDRIAITTSSTFSGTAIVRMGIYQNDTATGKPSTLILDAGTVSCTASSTVYLITINQTLTSGFYWMASNTQTAAATNVFIGNQSAQGAYNPLMPYKSSPTASFQTGWREESITGTFTTAGTLLSLGATPLTYLRAE